MKRRKHIHQYELALLGRDKNVWTYRCADANCNHYMPNHILKSNLVSRCWDCNEEMIIDTKVNTNIHPRCDDCNRLANSLVPSNIELDKSKENKDDIELIVEGDLVIEKPKRKLSHDEALDLIMAQLNAKSKIG